MINYYKPSGKYSPLSLIYLLLICTTIVPVLSWLYAYAIWYCPLIYINFFITLGFGALIGVGVHFIVIGLGKVRSSGIAILFGLLAGFWGFYLHWAIWIDLALNAEDGEGIVASHVDYDQLLGLIRDPSELFRIATLINEQGLWSIFKMTFSGFALWVVWLAESVIILALPPITALLKAKKPFSEKHGKWAREIKLNPFSYPTPEVVESIKEGELSSLKNLERGSKDTHHSDLTLFDAYDNNWFVSLTAKLGETDNKGKVKFKDIDLLEYAEIDTQLARVLQDVDEPYLEQAEVKDAQNSEPHESKFNSDNTKQIAALLQIDPSKRNEEWHEAFHRYILTAAFASGNPQVIEGPDGMPYFQLQFPEAKKPFNPFSLLHIKDHVLERGFGVVLCQADGQVVWSIPHGAMVNLHLNGEIFTYTDQPDLPEHEVLQEKTEVLYGQPSEEYFPTATRAVLKDFLRARGITEPKVALMMRNRPEGTTNELVFNIHTEDFKSEEQFESLMKMVQWFLPSHYIITALPKGPEFTEHLQPL